MQTFEGRVAVVTGAASGIGFGLAERFAAEGMSVVLADVEASALEEATARLAALGATVEGVVTDVQVLDSVENLAVTTEARFGRVDILCNNAGVVGDGRYLPLDVDDWAWVLGVNLWGTIHGIKAFLPRMVAGGDEAHIVNTASMAGLLSGGMTTGAYPISKAAVVALSESLRTALRAAGHPIGVSVLCPGVVRSNIARDDRNRPDGPRPPSPEGDSLRSELEAMFAGGMAPSAVADRVVEAIRANRLYVLTHGEFASALSKRAERILASSPPMQECR